MYTPAQNVLDATTARLEPLMHDAGRAAQDTLSDLRRGSRDLARAGADAVRDRALRARYSTEGFVHHRPLSSLLIAAATGAALLALAAVLVRSLGRPH